MARKGSNKRNKRKQRARARKQREKETPEWSAFRVRAGLSFGMRRRSQTFRDRRKEANRRACRGKFTGE